MRAHLLTALHARPAILAQPVHTFHEFADVETIVLADRKEQLPAVLVPSTHWLDK
jgi:hypothetical protein